VKTSNLTEISSVFMVTDSGGSFLLAVNVAENAIAWIM
jgi:hypothetical protein